MRKSKVVLFFNAWHDEFYRYNVRPKPLGQIAYNIKKQQAALYDRIRQEYVRNTEALIHVK